MNKVLLVFTRKNQIYFCNQKSIFGFKKDFAYVCARVWVGGQILKNEIYYLTKKELENEYVLLDGERA